MANKRGDRLSNSIRQGAEIEGMRYKNKASLPKQGDIYAQTFSDIGKAFSAPGDRPRGILRNFGAGLAKGAETASKLNSLDEREKDYEEHANVMNYFREVNDSAIEQNQWYETREKARTEMMPQVLSYMDNIDRLDPQSQRIMAQDMLAQYGEAIGENFKLSSIDGSNPFLMTIQSDKGQQLFDLRSMFAGDEAIQQSIAMKMPEYQIKLQQERQDKQRKFDLQEDALDVKKFEKGIPGGRYGVSSNDSGDDYGSISIKRIGAKGIAPFMKTINSKINLAEEVPVILHQIEEAERIIASNPALGKAWTNLVGGNAVAKNLLSDETRAAYEEVDKIADRVAEAFIRSKGGDISDAERHTIKGGLFKVTNSAEGNKYNINSVKKELMLAKERGDFAAEELAKGNIATSKSFENYKKSLAKSSGIAAEQGGGDIWDDLGKPSQ